MKDFVDAYQGKTLFFNSPTMIDKKKHSSSIKISIADNATVALVMPFNRPCNHKTPGIEVKFTPFDSGFPGMVVRKVLQDHYHINIPYGFSDHQEEALMQYPQSLQRPGRNFRSWQAF